MSDGTKSTTGRITTSSGSTSERLARAGIIAASKPSTETYSLGAHFPPHLWAPREALAWWAAAPRHTRAELAAMSVDAQLEEVQWVWDCVSKGFRACNINPDASNVVDAVMRAALRALEAAQWAEAARANGRADPVATWDDANSFTWRTGPGPTVVGDGSSLPTPYDVSTADGRGPMPFRAIVPPRWWTLHPNPIPRIVPGTDVYQTFRAQDGQIPSGFLKEEVTALAWDWRPRSAYGLTLVVVDAPIRPSATGTADLDAYEAALPRLPGGSTPAGAWDQTMTRLVPGTASEWSYIGLPEQFNPTLAATLHIVPSRAWWWSTGLELAAALRATDPRVLLIGAAMFTAAKCAYLLRAYNLGTTDQRAAAETVLAQVYAQQDAVDAGALTTYGEVAGAVDAVIAAVNPIAGAFVGVVLGAVGLGISLEQSHVDTREVDYWGLPEPHMVHMEIFDPDGFEPPDPPPGYVERATPLYPDAASNGTRPPTTKAGARGDVSTSAVDLLTWLGIAYAGWKIITSE